MKRIWGMTLAGAVTIAMAAGAQADTADGASLIGKPWEEVVAQARGGTVNWFLWGGADNINRYVSEFIGGILEDKYDITLNRVGLNDTVEAVNIVLGEKEAGVDDSGSVDTIWINGENFRTMKQADLAFCGYVDTLPNNALVNWDNPAIANDFGVPVDGCEVPWSRAQFAFAYDSAVTENPPQSIPELIEWIKANPGQFTYPAPPDFSGSVFVRHVFYHAAGGVENLLGPFDQEKFDTVAAKDVGDSERPRAVPVARGPDLPGVDHRASAALRETARSRSTSAMSRRSSASPSRTECFPPSGSLLWPDRRHDREHQLHDHPVQLAAQGRSDGAGERSPLGGSTVREGAARRLGHHARGSRSREPPKRCRRSSPRSSDTRRSFRPQSSPRRHCRSCRRHGSPRWRRAGWRTSLPDRRRCRGPAAKRVRALRPYPQPTPRRHPLGVKPRVRPHEDHSAARPRQ